MTIIRPASASGRRHQERSALGGFRDRERADDQIVQLEGAAVVLVGQEVAKKVKDTTIDYEEGETGSGLVVKRS